jgi:SAM-dependent methyltransferase
VLFDRFSEFRSVLLDGLTGFSDDALQTDPPSSGDRVLDVGCGFGDMSQRLGEIVGPTGSVVGVDVADRFVEASREEAAAAGATNVSFESHDVQLSVPDGPFDYAFSRMGTMFFANPAVAMRNIREALRPGGQLTMIVWREKPDNVWMARSEEIVNRYLEDPDPVDSDEPTCGPGPFSMANPETTSGILNSAGFDHICLRCSDMPFVSGRDVDEAVGLAMGLGPAAEVIRLSGDDAEQIRPEIERDLRELAAEFDCGDGVVAPASAWIVTANAPVGAGRLL